MRWKVHAARARLTVTAVLLAGTVAVAPLAGGEPAYASSGISERLGWDACGVGSTGNAQAFWSNTPFSNMGLYLGGSSYGGGCTRWNAGQVNTLLGQGWRFLPLWVGPQAPCTGFGSRFSSDPGTAYQQGTNEALSAYQRIQSLGWDTPNAPVIYDLEGFNTANSSCLTAAQNFISGWVHQMRVAPAQRAGVYGSACASGLSAYAAIANVPDFIDGADWSGNRNTNAMACVPSGYWVFHQRHKQYRGDHLETWNGVTLNIDSDCSNAPVYPGPDALSTSSGCL
jgi:hypothetical protein